jgi:4-hydroxy-3-methylbut-2-enyl diphosphate reductase
MGQYQDQGESGGIHLVVTVQDVEQLEIKDPAKIAYVTQTTLSMDDTGEVITTLRRRFPLIESPKKDDICYATQNRQDAVKDLANSCDLVLVVGSPNSSNSNRLREVAERLGTKAFLIDDGDQIRKEWLNRTQRIGVTAGASAPEVLVNGVITRLQKWGGQLATERDTKPEEVSFPLPRELT